MDFRLLLAMLATVSALEIHLDLNQKETLTEVTMNVTTKLIVECRHQVTQDDDMCRQDFQPHFFVPNPLQINSNFGINSTEWKCQRLNTTSDNAYVMLYKSQLIFSTIDSHHSGSYDCHVFVKSEELRQEYKIVVKNVLAGAAAVGRPGDLRFAAICGKDSECQVEEQWWRRSVPYAVRKHTEQQVCLHHRCLCPERTDLGTFNSLSVCWRGVEHGQVCYQSRQCQMFDSNTYCRLDSEGDDEEVVISRCRCRGNYKFNSQSGRCSSSGSSPPLHAQSPSIALEANLPKDSIIFLIFLFVFLVLGITIGFLLNYCIQRAEQRNRPKVDEDLVHKLIDGLKRSPSVYNKLNLFEQQS